MKHIFLTLFSFFVISGIHVADAQSPSLDDLARDSKKITMTFECRLGQNTSDQDWKRMVGAVSQLIEECRSSSNSIDDLKKNLKSTFDTINIMAEEKKRTALMVLWLLILVNKN